jgi:serine/threonine protein kinase
MRQPFAAGGMSRIYRGEFDGQRVAVKEIDLVGLTLKQRNEKQETFIKELDIMVRLSHPNLIHIYGAMTDDHSKLKMVMHYAPDGTLRDLLDQVKFRGEGLGFRV